MGESKKEYALQQYLKRQGGWEALYYEMTKEERENWYDRIVSANDCDDPDSLLEIK